MKFMCSKYLFSISAEKSFKIITVFKQSQLAHEDYLKRHYSYTYINFYMLIQHGWVRLILASPEAPQPCVGRVVVSFPQVLSHHNAGRCLLICITLLIVTGVFKSAMGINLYKCIYILKNSERMVWC